MRWRCGLTAGATAGMGSWMGVGGDATRTFVTNGTLNTAGKIAMAASSAGISVAANKLAGNQASFQWRNVVTGAVTAGLMDKAGFSNPNSVFEAFNEGAGVISGFMDGIAGAAIGYGVSKGLYNEGSWNFRNVATDSFGNAVGNSIVRNRIEAENTRYKAELASTALNAQSSAVLSAGVDAQVSATASNVQQAIYDGLVMPIPDLFGLGSAQQSAQADALMAKAAEKRAGAIDGYNAMRTKTQGDIAAINATAKANAE